MISAFFSLSGRADSAHAALLLAHAHHDSGAPVTHLRIVEPGEAGLPRAQTRTATLVRIESEVGSAAQASRLVHDTISTALAAEHHVVLDLPRTCMRDDAIRSRLDVVFAAVGPTPFDEYAAATMLADGRNTTSSERAGGLSDVQSEPVAPWLLACSRSGGAPAAQAFATAIGAITGQHAVRVVPFAIPALSRTASERLLAGNPDSKTLSAGAALLAVARAIARVPRATSLDPSELDPAALFVSRDTRDTVDKMRALVDDLDGIAAGLKPTPSDLADAPLLEDWTTATKPARVMLGRVRGHPNFPARRRVATSEIYATDGRTWMRTLSRWYRLAPRAASGASARH